MGSGEESAPAKTAASRAPAAPPVPLASQDVSSTPPVYPEWQSMAAVYYGTAAAAGTPPGFFSPSSPSPHPYMWPSPHMIAPYGASIPYPAMYPGMYHPAMAPATTVTAAEIEGRSTDGKDRNSTKKSKGSLGNASQASKKSGDGAKATSTSANDDASQSGESGESGTEGSSSAREGDTNPQSIPGKRSYDKMIATGKVAVATPTTNLNIGMDIWNSSHGVPVPLKDRSNVVNISPSVAPSTLIGQNGVVPMSVNPQLSALDERELKRQRRKQSNRESARRSRLRKQQECEELAKKVEELSAENSTFRSEIDRLKEQCNKLESENASIKEELNGMDGPDVVLAIEGKSPATQPTDNGGDPNTYQNARGSNGESNGSLLMSNGKHEPGYKKI